jgi:hypothetical protein
MSRNYEIAIDDNNTNIGNLKIDIQKVEKWV